MIAIANDSAPPHELVEHTYRKLFHLTYEQMQTEPAHVVNQSLLIEKLLIERQNDEIKSAERQNNG